MVPAPPPLPPRAVFKSVISVQLDPSYCSTLSIVGESPPAASAEVEPPVELLPASLSLGVLRALADTKTPAGAPAAFPKPYNPMPEDKNISPSFK